MPDGPEVPPKAKQEKQKEPEAIMKPSDFVDAMLKIRNNIPGAKPIEASDMILEPGHEFVLVHVKQVHEHPDTPGRGEQAIRADPSAAEMIRVQTDIHHLMDYIYSRIGVFDLAMEGSSEDELTDHRKLYALLDYFIQQKKLVRNSLRQLKETTARTAQEQVALDRLVKQRQDGLKLLEKREKETRDTIDAAFLGMRETVRRFKPKLVPGSDLSLLPRDFDFLKLMDLRDNRDDLWKQMQAERRNDAWFRLRDQYEAVKAQLKPLEDRFHEERENIQLKLAVKNGAPVLFTRFGGLHNFKDNVDAWNKEEKNKAAVAALMGEKYKPRLISLIVITPKSYKDHLPEKSAPKEKKP